MSLETEAIPERLHFCHFIKFLFFGMNKFTPKTQIMLLEYQAFDLIGTNFSVKNPSELGSEKRSCYLRDTHHLKIGCGLVYFVKFSDGLWQFFP